MRTSSGELAVPPRAVRGADRESPYDRRADALTASVRGTSPSRPRGDPARSCDTTEPWRCSSDTSSLCLDGLPETLARLAPFRVRADRVGHNQRSHRLLATTIRFLSRSRLGSLKVAVKALKRPAK